MGHLAKFLVAAIIVGALANYCEAKDRIYYLAIKEIIWDYAPSGLNVYTGNKLDYEKIARIYSNMYIGKKYKKAVYRRYTDNTFTTEIPHDPNLGYMGPTIRAEVGDRILVHLFNNASRNFTVHPHGVFYTKANEGARYFDNDTQHLDDGVPPGGRYTYEWEVLEAYGPAKDDPNCMTWAYHSHTHSPVDINSGLIGALLVCRKGTYNDDETRTDVDHEFVAMFFIAHERETWYFWENLDLFMPNQTVDIKEKYFKKGNKMHAVNGYMYSNTPGYQVCQGDTISWQMIGMGSNRDLHPIHFQGQTLLRHHHRKDSFILIPATLVTSTMKADNPGRWMIACQLYSHFTEGMTALLEVDATCRKPSSPLPSDSLTGETRRYYVAAEEVLWDYGPSGLNTVTGEPLDLPGTDSATFFETGPHRIGGVYKKAVFRGYTSDSFADPSPHPEDMGILGPVIAGEIGDTLQVTFKNKAGSHAFNVEPHGVYFSEAYAVLPNMKHTYTWTLPDSVSPGDNDPDCITYLYTSSVEYIADSNSGLVGPLVVCKRGTLAAWMAKRNRYLMMTVYDENSSWYFKENLKRFAGDPAGTNTKSSDFKESNMMHSINGRMYGNLFGLDMCVDEDTTFHLLAVGTKFDIHAIKFDGINVRQEDIPNGAVNLFPHTSQTITVRPTNAVNGMVYCVLIDHLASGMFAVFESSVCNKEAVDEAEERQEAVEEDGITRHYFIAAEETQWDYSPSKLNIDGSSVNVKGNHGYDYAHREPGKTIGSTYIKALYYQYTDDTFTTKVPKANHLGFLGPIIKAEVGDKISITFFNKAKRPYNIHPWGAIDPNADNLDPVAVLPGERMDYEWTVPESAGTSGEQPSCVSFIYLSSVDKPIDATDGLMGPLLVCRKGGLDSGDIDEEFFLQFQVVNENLSHYIDDNIREFIGVEPSEFVPGKNFEESNKMKGINGYLSHVDGLNMYKDDIVRWHLIGWGNEKDYHSVHFHAHTYDAITDGVYRGDVFDVFPGFFGTVVMRTIAVGDWLLHCHVFDHMHGGMETTYSVMDSGITAEHERPHKECCEAHKDGHNFVLDCSGMGLANYKDLFNGNRWKVNASNGHGKQQMVAAKLVTSIDLSYNMLSDRAVVKVLKRFHNLRVATINGNPIAKLHRNLLSRNKHLATLVARNTPSLTGVARKLVVGRDMDMIDLSNNPQLLPACLNRMFISQEHFQACRDGQ